MSTGQCLCCRHRCAGPGPGHCCSRGRSHPSRRASSGQQPWSGKLSSAALGCGLATCSGEGEDLSQHCSRAQGGRQHYWCSALGQKSQLCMLVVFSCQVCTWGTTMPSPDTWFAALTFKFIHVIAVLALCVFCSAHQVSKLFLLYNPVENSP